MFTWIKSLIADVSAGSVLVMVSMGMVIALMVALGELATQQPDSDVLAVADHSPSRLITVGSSADDSQSAQQNRSAHRSTVSVMVPVSSFR